MNVFRPLLAGRPRCSTLQLSYVNGQPAAHHLHSFIVGNSELKCASLTRMCDGRYFIVVHCRQCFQARNHGTRCIQLQLPLLLRCQGSGFHAFGNLPQVSVDISKQAVNAIRVVVQEYRVCLIACVVVLARCVLCVCRNDCEAYKNDVQSIFHFALRSNPLGNTTNPMQCVRLMLVVKPTSYEEQAHSQYHNDELPPEMGLPEDTSGDSSIQTTPRCEHLAAKQLPPAKPIPLVGLRLLLSS